MRRQMARPVSIEKSRPIRHVKVAAQLPGKRQAEPRRQRIPLVVIQEKQRIFWWSEVGEPAADGAGPFCVLMRVSKMKIYAPANARRIHICLPSTNARA